MHTVYPTVAYRGTCIRKAPATFWLENIQEVCTWYLRYYDLCNYGISYFTLTLLTLTAYALLASFLGIHVSLAVQVHYIYCKLDTFNIVGRHKH